MLSIPEIATDLIDKALLEPNADNSRTLFLVGSKAVGKSTLLHNFLEKNDPIRETIVLEYSFGRKSIHKQDLDKTVCHFWEYGGRLEMLKSVLSSIPIKNKFFFCIVVDLSKCKSIWNTLEICINAISETCKDSPAEIIIMGGKYDIFQNYDSEIKKCVCTTIRSVALLYQAHVIYYSSKDVQLARKAKEMFNNIGFGNGITFKEKIVNYNKPLLIAKNSDNWESIGVPASDLNQIKIRSISRIQPESTAQETTSFQLQLTHPEPILDSMMTLKYQELRSMELFEPAMDEYLSHLQ